MGALLGIPGIIIAWLVNVDKMPQVKSDALKFAIIGFVIWIVLQFIFGMIVFGTISAAMYGLMNSVDMAPTTTATTDLGNRPDKSVNRFTLEEPSGALPFAC